VAHHQKTHRVHTEFARKVEMLARYIGFRAMRCHAHDACACIERLP